VFGPQAATARGVVDAAVASWARVITDFKQFPPLLNSNRIDIEISMNQSGTGNGGGASVTNFDLFGHPTAGRISLGRGGDLNGDGRGDGGGWFLDPTPFDNSEFTGDIVNAFAGDAQTGSPAAGLADLFTVVGAELTHVMGLFSSPARLQNPENGRLVSLGIPDDSTDAGGVGRYFVFDGPSVTHLLTSNNGGPNGEDFGEAVHSAGPNGPSQPIAFTSLFRGNRQLFGDEDIGNARFERGRRYLVSDVMALVLHDAYSYTITRPERFGTFYAVLDQSTGNLLIRGGDGASADNITLRRDGADLVVSVNVGIDPSGSHANGDNGNAAAWDSHFNFAALNSITIQPGDGDDAVTLDFAGGDVIPAGGIDFDGGAGTDEINAIADANFNLTDARLNVIGFGLVDLTSVADADLTGGAGDNSFTVSGWSGSGTLDGAGGTDTVFATNAGNFALTNTALSRTGRQQLALTRMENASLTGDANDNRFAVSLWTGTATLNGLGGVNEVVSANDADFTLSNTNLTRSTGGDFTLQGIGEATLTGGASANTFTVSGWTGTVDLNGSGGGDDYRITLNGSASAAYTVADSGTSGTDDLTVTGTALVDQLTVRKDSVSSLNQSVNYSGIERLQVNGGASDDTINVQSTSTSLIVNGDTGNDTINLTYNESFQFDPVTNRLIPVFSIPDSVLVNGTTGTADVVNVSFSGFLVGNDGNLTSNRLTGTLLGGDGLSYSNVDRLNLNFGGSADTLNVLSTAAATVTAINTAAGADTIRLGGSTVNGIDGPVTIDAGANVAGTSDAVILQEFEPAGTVNLGQLGTPASAGAGTGFLSGFGMGASVNFTNTEAVAIIEGPSNDFISFSFASPPQFGFGLSLDGGTDGVIFHGTDGNDRIRVSRRVGANGPEVIADINGQIISGGYSGGETVSVFAGDGNDLVEIDPSVTTWTAELYGEDGNDHLVGSSQADRLDGGRGNDHLDGLGGNDVLVGGVGQDVLDGGDGADQIDAGDGDKDVIFADLADVLVSIDANDVVKRR
jgi:hypothetical protein